MKKVQLLYYKSSITPIDPNHNLRPHKGKPVKQKEYAKIIGSLMHVMNLTRADITYAVSRLCKFTRKSSKEQLEELTRVDIYEKTINYALQY